LGAGAAGVLIFWCSPGAKGFEEGKVPRKGDGKKLNKSLKTIIRHSRRTEFALMGRRREGTLWKEGGGTNPGFQRRKKGNPEMSQVFATAYGPPVRQTKGAVDERMKESQGTQVRRKRGGGRRKVLKRR